MPEFKRSFSSISYDSSNVISDMYSTYSSALSCGPSFNTQRLMPIRSSTMKQDRQNASVKSKFSDIRSYFPVMSRNQQILFRDKPSAIWDLEENIYEDNHKSSNSQESSSGVQSFDSGSTETFELHPVISRKRTAEQSNLSQYYERSCKESKVMKPSMGAGIKSHPRYQRVMTECNFKPEPICRVPLPLVFQHLKNLPITTIPETRTVETQTSPLLKQEYSPISITPKSTTKRIRTSRRMSGTSMLTNLRKSIGTLRRAMSAERLNPNSDAEMRSAPPTPKSVQKFFSTAQNSPVKVFSNTKRVLFSPIKSRFARTNPKFSRSIRNPLEQIKPVVANPLISSVPDLSWTIMERHRDGSFKIRLDRTNTEIMFGVNVAKDSEGFYVSRLGSVRSVAAYWDLIHAGDRILQVNDLDLSNENITVVNLRAMIQNRLSVEFFIRPSQPRQLGIPRSSSQSSV